MLTQVARGWRVYAVRGVAAIIFGIAALVWPGPTLEVLVYLFGAFAFTDGIAMLFALAQGDHLARRHAWTTGLSGLTGIIIAGVTLFWPGITALALLYMVAIWAVATGILQIIAAIEFRKVIAGEIWMILGGALSVVYGTLLVINPGTGLISLAYLTGFYAIMLGGSSLGVAHRLHNITDDLKIATRTHPSTNRAARVA